VTSPGAAVLRVIREQLRRGEEPGRSGRPALVAVGDPDPDPGAAADPAAEEVRLSRPDLLARAGIDDALLAQMRQHGLVAPRTGGWYDADALAVAEAVRDLDRHGLQPRHLRAYQVAADREAGLFAQLLTPLLRRADPAARARAAQTLRELTALSQRLHAALVRAGLRETIGR
jgi:hypothetical protein